jgi:hypothetical protein
MIVTDTAQAGVDTVRLHLYCRTVTLDAYERGLHGQRPFRWPDQVRLHPAFTTHDGTLGLVTLASSGLAAAKKTHKHKKKIKRNALGCVNVGNFCKHADQCCSGICQGRKGKKKCRAHNATTCQATQTDIYCAGGTHFPCITSTAFNLGSCFTTTGNAGYCAYKVAPCLTCAKDADGRSALGDGAACILCPHCSSGRLPRRIHGRGV